MFKPLLTRVLNHLANQNNWAKADLQPFGGKSVRFKIPPTSLTLTILEDGGLAPAGNGVKPDATVALSPTTALRLLAKDETAQALVELDGDTELATALARTLRCLTWEYEEDLSKVIGDVPAHQLAAMGRKTVQEIRRQTWNLAEMLSEYWQEEQPLLSKKRYVMQFIAEVDELRDGTERLSKRIEKLEAKLSSDKIQASTFQQ